MGPFYPRKWDNIRDTSPEKKHMQLPFVATSYYIYIYIYIIYIYIQIYMYIYIYVCYIHINTCITYIPIIPTSHEYGSLSTYRVNSGVFRPRHAAICRSTDSSFGNGKRTAAFGAATVLGNERAILYRYIDECMHTICEYKSNMYVTHNVCIYVYISI